MRAHIFTLFIIGSLLITGCDISENTALPNESFLKIYDNQNFDASFIPIDIKQTQDRGYLILGARRVEDSDFTGVYLMRVDSEGNIVQESEVDETYIHPIQGLIQVDNQYHFIAMTNTSWQANYISVDPDSLTINPTALGGLSYPLYAKQFDDEVVLLSYNNADKQSIISSLSTDGNVGTSEAYSIGAGADVEAPIIEHFTRTGKQLPFFTGKVGGNYFFNGFFNYTMSMVITDLAGDGPDGVIQGQQADGGFSSGMAIDGSRFAISRYNFGDNFINPSAELDLFGISSTTDIEGNPFPELTPDAPVVLKQIEVNNESITLYASNTKGNQVILMAFNTLGDLLGTRYIGYSDPYEISSFIQTDDGGLAVVGTVYVAGRFARIFINKLSEGQLSSIIN